VKWCSLVDWVVGAKDYYFVRFELEVVPGTQDLRFVRLIGVGLLEKSGFD